jgi:transposase InsO family protein
MIEPRRAQPSPPCRRFLKAHWKVLAASDFLTVEVWTGRGLVTHYLLFVVSLADRVVNIAGITTRPDEPWMLQIGRNLTDAQSGALDAKRYLIIDRDSNTPAISAPNSRSRNKVIRLPPMSPNLNAYAERFVRSIKDECLNRMIFIGQASLRRAVAEYMEHYHVERNRQGLENRLVVPGAMDTNNDTVLRHARLGGTLNFYYRKAA